MAEDYQISKRPFTSTCPECGGALSPATGGPVPRYVCHIGHSLTWPALVDAQLARTEFQLCTALVQVKERRAVPPTRGCGRDRQRYGGAADRGSARPRREAQGALVLDVEHDSAPSRSAALSFGGNAARAEGTIPARSAFIQMS